MRKHRHLVQAPRAKSLVANGRLVTLIAIGRRQNRDNEDGSADTTLSGECESHAYGSNDLTSLRWNTGSFKTHRNRVQRVFGMLRVRDMRACLRIVRIC